MVVGLAFAVAVFAGRTSVAAAKFDEGTQGARYVTAGGWSGEVDMESGVPVSAGIPEGDEQYIDGVVPYLSQGILAAEGTQVGAATASHDPYLTDVFVRPGEALGGPDGIAPSVSHVALTAVRPDDRGNRFAHSDVAQPELVSSSSGSTIEWGSALTAGIGALVLVLGLGLAFGYLKRPRLAGL
jgi:hypothetical protein